MAMEDAFGEDFTNSSGWEVTTSGSPDYWDHVDPWTTSLDDDPWGDDDLDDDFWSSTYYGDDDYYNEWNEYVYDEFESAGQTLMWIIIFTCLVPSLICMVWMFCANCKDEK